MLEERQKSILEAVIQEHIRTARPVASRELLEKFQFGISPATVRSDMLKLDDMGYLRQPHTSAGRIPTDKGYRFFVDEAVADAFLRDNDQETLDKVFTIDDEEQFSCEFTKTVARMARAFTIVGVGMDRVTFEAGFSEVLQEPEFENTAQVRVFLHIIDFLDKEMSAITENLEKNAARIFIGEENPVKEAQDYTLMISAWEHPEGFRGSLMLIGPKRMNYRRNISILRYLRGEDRGNDQD